MLAARMSSSRLMRMGAAGTGVVLAGYGFRALLSIPRMPREFTYQNPTGGNAFWPLPFAPLNGFTPEQLSSHVARALFLFPACVLLGFALQHGPRWRRWPQPLAPLLGTLITGVIALLILRGVPLQDDEATYLMQADLLTRGLIADPAYPMSAAFAEPFTIFTRAGMTGMYLFGTPMVLAGGLPWGMPWLGQLALVALTLWAAMQAAARSGEPVVAWLGSVLLATSPMLTFTSAGALSQVGTLAGLAVAILGLSIGAWRGGALMGMGLGFACATRPQSAIPAGLALIVVYGWRDRRLLGGLLLAGLPWVVAIGLYNHAILGTAWQLPRAAYTGELERYGFGTVIRHYEHTLPKAVALLGVVLVRFNGWALGWPLSLAGTVLWCLLGRPHRASVGPWAVVALATFLVQAGYASIGTSETGPIYHYAALPFFVFSTAAVLHDAGSRRWGRALQAAALVSMLLGTTTFYVEHGYRLERLAAEIEGPRRTLALEPPAVVLEDVWGDRPQIGWVFGLPFRERSPSSPVVRYPRPTRAVQLEALMTRWPDRHCSHLGYDWQSSRYRLGSCSDLGAPDPTPGNSAPPGSSPDLTKNHRAWFEEGGWREAFPYWPFRRN